MRNVHKATKSNKQDKDDAHDTLDILDQSQDGLQSIHPTATDDDYTHSV